VGFVVAKETVAVAAVFDVHKKTMLLIFNCWRFYVSLISPYYSGYNPQSEG